MLVGEGGADGEAGGDSACSSAELQLVGVLRRGKCSGAAAATGREGRTGGARGRRSELGRVRFDPGQTCSRSTRTLLQFFTQSHSRKGIPSAHMHWDSISDLATLGMWADPGSYAWYVGGPRYLPPS